MFLSLKRPAATFFVKEYRHLGDDLRARRRDELVELRLTEAVTLETLPGFVRQIVGFVGGDQGYSAAAPARTRNFGPEGSGPLCYFYERIKLRDSNFVVVAQRGVRLVQQPSERFEVSVTERLDRLRDPLLLGDNVSGAL